jgi:hypothetical protein
MKANGPDELRRFKASAARHFAQWFYDETDEDHAAAVTFNINGAEFVKGKIRVENIARIDKVNKAEPEEVSVNEYEDRVHARETQERFNFPLYDETYTTAAADATAPSLTLDSLVKASSFLTPPESKEIARTVLGVDYAKDDSYDRAVYVVGLAGKEIFVIPEDLREDFENIMLAKDGEAVVVNDATLDLVRFNGMPIIYTDNLGASPLDPKPYNEQYVGQSIPPSWNPVVENFKFAIQQEDRVRPFLDLMRQRMFESQLDLAERYERSIWSVPDFSRSCSGDKPFNFIQRLLIKLQDFYQDLKTKLAEKLLDIATDLDPYVVDSGK